MEGMTFARRSDQAYTWDEVDDAVSQCQMPWQMSGVLHNIALQFDSLLQLATPKGERVTRSYSTAVMFLSAAKSEYPELRKTALTMLFSRILPHVPLHPSLISFHLEVLQLLRKRPAELCAGTFPDKVFNYLRLVESVLWKHNEPNKPGCSHWSTRHEFDCRESARFLRPHQKLVFWAFLEFGQANYLGDCHFKKAIADVIRQYLEERGYNELALFSFLASGNVNKRLDEPDAQMCVNAKAFLKLLEIEYWEQRNAESATR